MPKKLPKELEPNYKMGKKNTEEVLREGFKEVKQPGLSSHPTGSAPAIGAKAKTTGTSNTGVARGRGTVSGTSNAARKNVSTSGSRTSTAYSSEGRKTREYDEGLRDLKHDEPTEKKPKSYIKLPKKKDSYIKLPKKGG